MKKFKLFLFFMIGMIVPNICNAASLEVSLECPQTAVKGNNITCNIYANQSDITAIDAKFNFGDLTYVSETITNNSIFTTSKTASSEGFSVSSSEELPKYFKLGQVTLKVSDSLNEGIYNVSLTDIKGIDLQNNSVNINDTFASIIVLNESNKIKKIESFNNLYYILYEDGTLLYSDSSVTKQISSNVDDIVYVYHQYAIWYLKNGNELYQYEHEYGKEYKVLDGFSHGDIYGGYFIANNNLYEAGTPAVSVHGSKVDSEDNCYSENTYDSENGLCYYVSNNSELVKENVTFVSGEYFVTDTKELYKANGTEYISLNLANVKDINFLVSTLFVLTENNELYVYGANIFGNKVNGGEEITTPVKILDNVIAYDQYYALTSNKELYTWTIYTNRVTKIQDSVDKVLAKTDSYIVYMVGDYSYIDKIESDGNGALVTTNLSKVKGEIQFLQPKYEYNVRYCYIDGNNNLYCSKKISYDTYDEEFVASNVKEILDSAGAYSLSYLTLDNELYEFIDLWSYDYSAKLQTRLLVKDIKEHNTYIDNNYYYYDYYVTSLGELLNYEFSELTTTSDEPILSTAVSIENPKSTIISVGDTIDLVSKIYPINATSKKVVFTSSNESVASVTEDGFLTALSTGTTTITVTTLDTLKTYSIDIEVKPAVSSIVVKDEDNKEIDSLNLKVSNEDGYSVQRANLTVTLLPEDALNKDYTVEVSDSTMLNVEKSDYCYNYDTNESYSCLIVSTYNKPGNATITISSANKKVQKVIDVTVYDEKIEKIYLKDSNNNNIDGAYITASGEDGEEVYRDYIKLMVDPVGAIEKEIIWSVSDDTMVRLEADGYVTTDYDSDQPYKSAYLYVYNKTGDVTITASTEDGTVIQTATLHIVEKVNFTPRTNNITLDLNNNKTYQIKLTADKEYDKDMLSYRVSSTGSNIISVSEDGIITALNEGYTTVYVDSIYTLGGKQSENYLYVTVTSNDFVESKPSKPTIRIENKDESSITLAWGNVEHAQEYQIYRSTDNKKFTKVETVYEAGYVDTNVKSGYTYYYKVRPVNTVGSGSYSNVVSARVPLEETSMEVKSVTYNSITLTWDKISGVTGYQIYRSTKEDSGFSLHKTITKSSTTSYKNASLKNGTRYYYKIRTYKTVNGKKVYSGFSDVVNAMPKVGDVNLKVNKYSHNTLNLTWSKVTGATSYQIYSCIDGDCTKIKTTSSTSYKVTGLTLGEENTYAVRACRTASSKTSCGDYTYESQVVAPAKTSITVGDTTNTSIDLKLKKVTGATYYVIEYKESSETDYTTDITTELDYTIDNLAAGKTYNIRAYAVYETESEPIYSNVYSITKKLTPQTPAGVTATLESFGKIKVAWEADENITTYKVYRSTKKSSGYKLVATVNDNYYYDTKVTTNTTYYYKVRAYKNSSYSSYSTVKSAKSYLSKPTITLKSNSYNSINISYDEVDGATGYQIYRATSKNGKYTKIKTTTSLSYTNSSLKFNKNYYYKVRAYVKINGKTYYSSYSTVKYTKPALSKPTFDIENTETGNNIIINKVSGASGYQIYRKENDGSYVLIKTTTSLKYIDANITADTTYTYKIRAYRTVSKKKYYSSYSEEKIDENVQLES